MIVLFLLLLLAFPGAALAQEPVTTPTAGIEDQAPGVGGEDADDPVDDEDPVDGDDAYTCGEAGTDADYTYCAAAGAGGPKRNRLPRPVATVQAVPAGTLPLTGGTPAIVALLGVSFVLTGAGLRRMMAT